MRSMNWTGSRDFPQRRTVWRSVSEHNAPFFEAKGEKLGGWVEGRR